MDCLYKVTTKNTLDEFKRFSRKLFASKKNIIIFSLLGVFLILEGILLESWFCVIFAFIYPLIMLLIHDRQAKKIFSSNKVLQNTVVEYEFYDTYFTASHDCGNDKLEYNKLHKIIETKNNFYLLIAKNQGYILTKSTFPSGLEDFLRNIKIS